MLAVFVGLFGMLIGSFLNVVAYRIPLHRSIVSPPSACTDCGSQIKGYDNIPVVSWLVLRGKCRNCGSVISARYPVVELATGLFFAAATVWFVIARVPIRSWSTGPASVAGALELVAFLYLAAISVALTLIDLDTHKLPNRIVLPSYLVGGALLLGAALLGDDGGALARAGIGMAALGLAYLGMALAYPGGMGFGDVKLAGLLGLYLGYLGWEQLLVGAFAAFLLGGLFSIALMVLRRVNRKSGIPFGPWMLGGAWLGVFFGAPVALGYLSVFGLR
ncbi:MAG: prepilin peptidase [Microbacteriaceae bacterium]|nr:prepilin peptidase [Microbacteriaceae bacterium]